MKHLAVLVLLMSLRAWALEADNVSTERMDDSAPSCRLLRHRVAERQTTAWQLSHSAEKIGDFKVGSSRYNQMMEEMTVLLRRLGVNFPELEQPAHRVTMSWTIPNCHEMEPFPEWVNSIEKSLSGPAMGWSHATGELPPPYVLSTDWINCKIELSTELLLGEFCYLPRTINLTFHRENPLILEGQF